MTAKTSAGILLYRRTSGTLQVLLVHPGGPLYARKDSGVWSIPKGEFTAVEDPLSVAVREFEEELGQPVGNVKLTALSPVKQAGGKVVSAWAGECDCDVSAVHSNTFSMEWPPRSGKLQEFPEVDRAEWFSVDDAHEKLIPAQRALLDQLKELLGG